MNQTMDIAEIKDAVRERDGYKCVQCSLTQAEHLERHGRKLDVHRRQPDGEYSFDNCEALCKRCHGAKSRKPAGPRKERRRFSGDARLEVRAPEVLMDLVHKVAGRIGVSDAAYIRMALIEKLRRDVQRAQD